MKRATRTALLLLACFAGQAWALPAVGDKAPEFTLRDLAESPHSVESAGLFSGKTTLLSFFATWCNPCKEEMPKLRALALEFVNRSFQVVFVSLDQVEADDIRAFLKDAGAEGSLSLWDEEGDTMGLYGVFSLPTNVLVDPSGKVLMAWQGYQEGKLRELKELIEKLPQARHEGSQVSQ